MDEEELQMRLEQLRRLKAQVNAAIQILEARTPFMPLQEHIHPACLIVGDFTIVDKTHSGFFYAKTC